MALLDGSIAIGIFAVVLIEFAVKSLAANAEGASSVSFVAVGVIQSRFNRLFFYLIH